ncbi:MAG: hypothetical protein NVSMB65_20730 [Chloroflexota bacterium]
MEVGEMAHQEPEADELTLAEAARDSGVTEEALRHAMVRGELRFRVAATGDGLAFVCTPRDLDGWRARGQDGSGPHPHWREHGIAASRGECTVDDLLCSAAEYIATSSLTVMRLGACLDQSAAALDDLAAHLAPGVVEAEAPPDLRALAADVLVRQADMGTRGRLIMGLTQRRLERARICLDAVRSTLAHRGGRAGDRDAGAGALD